MPVVAFVGHSYIRRMGEYVANHPSSKHSPPEVNWRYIGIGGASVDPEGHDWRNVFHYIPQISALRPVVILIHIGENDLGRLLPHEILHNIVILVNRLAISCRPARIVVGQMFDFPNNRAWSDASKYINDELFKYWRGEANQPLPTRVQFWRQKVGVFGPEAASHFIDGVHLDDRTMGRYVASNGTITSRCYNAARREQQ